MSLMYCPQCGKHFEVMAALGQWIATHCDPETYIRFCWPEESPLYKEGRAHSAETIGGHEQLEALELGH
jgi:hypothetical protein